MEQRLEAGSLPRHRHQAAYAAIVLSGGYLEAGGEGRWRVEPGDVVFHPAFDAHQNQVSRRSTVLNVPLDTLADLPPVFRVADPVALERAGRDDLHEAATRWRPVSLGAALSEDWPDLLAAAIRVDPALRLGDWAHGCRLAPATVSRGFFAAFGVTPSQYRAERRAHLAWRGLTRGTAPLAAVAQDCGFADQAHMSRAVRTATGATPGAWRRIKSLQDLGRV